MFISHILSSPSMLECNVMLCQSYWFHHAFYYPFNTESCMPHLCISLVSILPCYYYYWCTAVIIQYASILQHHHHIASYLYLVGFLVSSSLFILLCLSAVIIKSMNVLGSPIYDVLSMLSIIFVSSCSIICSTVIVSIFLFFTYFCLTLLSSNPYLSCFILYFSIIINQP